MARRDFFQKTNKHFFYFFCFFTLHRKKTPNSFVCFLGESTVRKSAYGFIWPLSLVHWPLRTSTIYLQTNTGRLFSVLYVSLEAMNVPKAKKKWNELKWITLDSLWFLPYNFMFWLKQNSILKILLTMVSSQKLCQQMQILLQGKYILILLDFSTLQIHISMQSKCRGIAVKPL